MGRILTIAERILVFLLQDGTYLAKSRFFNRANASETQPDLKDVLPKTIYLIPSKRKPKWAVFRCPCGCDEVLRANLMASHYPSWRLIFEGDNTLSFTPSFWVSRKRCGSHFFIFHSRILWTHELLDLSSILDEIDPRID